MPLRGGVARRAGVVSGKENDMKKTIIIAVAVLLLGTLVMVYAGVRLLETNKVYQEADAVYEVLSKQVRKNATAEPAPLPAQELAAMDSPSAQESEHEARIPVYIPDVEIDFDLLRGINGDSAAWLYSPGTVIDYPVMKAEDYYYYLNHLSDGTVNANGSLFIDYNNAPDFSDDLTVIYGHHMKSGRMFGGLVGYKEQRFYEEHPFMYLYTETQNYRIDLMYGSVIGAWEWRDNAFMYEENIEDLISYAKNNTTFTSDVDYQAGDRLVVLSTCSYEYYDARYFVVGRLTN